MKNYTLLLLSLLIFEILPAQQIVLKAAKLIDGTGNTIEKPFILIEAGRIVSVTTKLKIPETATVIDLGSYTLLPGLIDAHVHPNNNSDDYQVAHLKTSSAAKALISLKAVQELLQAGWTALRVAGDADVGYSNFEVRNAINKGAFAGPHIYGAGHYLSVTGGGGDINFFSPEQNILPDGLIVNGPEEIRKAVRNEIKYGSDWIKILETGAFMTVGDNPQNVHFSPEELKAVIEEAGRRDIPVMAHAHATEGIRQAVQAGVRSIEHGTYLNDDCIGLMLQHGTYLIPTLTIDLYFKELIPDSKALVKAIDLAKKTRADFYAALRKAIVKGVKIGVGTDYVGWPAVYSAREFAELVSLGMSPMQAIMAGTKVNAELLRKDKDIGTIEAGKLADIIAVKGDPLQDITELQRVKFVMIGGQVVKNEK